MTFYYVGGLSTYNYLSTCTCNLVINYFCFSHLSQNTRTLYGCEPRDCEEEDLLQILVI